MEIVVPHVDSFVYFAQVQITALNVKMDIEQKLVQEPFALHAILDVKPVPIQVVQNAFLIIDSSTVNANQ